MRFQIDLRGDHLLASLQGRETAEQMREFLIAVHAACGQHRCPRILMSIRAQLLAHLERTHATHYSWEVCSDPATREAELLRDYRRLYGRAPRDNAKA